MDGRALWQERFQQFLSVYLRYMRLIANSGLLFSGLFLLIFGSYYYALFLRQIPEQFPAFLLIALVMTFFVSKGKIRTFLKQADVVYLLPAERRLKGYFSQALLYNIVIQVTGTVVIALVFAPLYARWTETNMSAYPYFGIVLTFVFAKVWNVLVRWEALKLSFARLMLGDTLVRLTATFLLFYLVLIGAEVGYIAIVALVMLVFYLYVAKVTSRQQLIKWERLLTLEQELTWRFYKFVHAFVDIPLIAKQVKKRKWTRLFTGFLPFEYVSVARTLYISAFFRSGQYFGIYVRLFIVGVMVLAFLPPGYGKAIGLVLFLYITAVQLLPLKQHYVGVEQIKLYPFSELSFSRVFQTLIGALLLFQNLLFSVTIYLSGSPLVFTFVVFLSASVAIFLYIRLSVKEGFSK